jgi:Na+-transporting NADH:ubiquinone oxidoreductase subunit C
MADFNPISWWRRMLALPNTSFTKTLAVAVMVSLTCGIVVSVTSVALRPLQQANLEAARRASMSELLAALPGMEALLLEAGADSLEPVLVDLNTGTIVTDMDAATYDQRAAAADPETSLAIPADADLANLGRRALYAPVYIVRSGGEIALLVLPVHGTGYQSKIYAYLALEADLNTIAAYTVYEQAETPGLGTRVQDAAWEALWPGTEIADESGEIRVEVVRGQATGPYQVDGITGATRTSNAVTSMLRFWLGDYGFGPFLQNLAAGEIAQ